MRITTLLAACLAIGLVGCGSDETEPKRDDAFVRAAKACHDDSELSCPRPIFNVRDLHASQRYYRDKLGFTIDWDHGDPPDFGSVSRGDAVIFMCQGCQGHPGAWMMVFARDVDKLYDDLHRRGAKIEQPPSNKPWGLREMNVADLDGNIIRFAGPTDH
jgi:catechol 2,3-dioxygenase-like lactoylglutathione lyase family enzyme